MCNRYKPFTGKKRVKSSFDFTEDFKILCKIIAMIPKWQVWKQVWDADHDQMVLKPMEMSYTLR